MKKFIKNISYFKFNLYVILLFLIGLVVYLLTGTPWIMSAPGLLLIFYLPGNALFSITKLGNYFTKYLSIFWKILISFVTVSIAELIASKVFISPTFNSQVAMLLALNIFVLLIGATLFNKAEKKSPSLEKRDMMFMGIAVFITFLPLVMSWLLYPYLPGDDTYELAISVRNSLIRQELIQPLADRRPIFTPMVLLINYVSRVPILVILRYFIPSLISGIFLMPFFAIYPLVKNNSKYIGLLTLIFISAPYLLYQIQYTIPQSFILLLSIPTILLAVEGLKNNSLTLLIYSLVFAISGIGYHELSLILILSSFSGIVVFAYRYARKNPRDFWIKAIWTTAFVLPYLIILQVFSKIASLSNIITSGIGSPLKNLRFELWYVDYYTNPDGIIFSYPGASGLIWYAYLGAPILLMTIIIYIFLKRSHKKRLLQDFWSYTPLSVFFLIFFFVAEIQPRISKIAFLPERAWIFLDISLIIAITYFIIEAIKNNEGSKIILNNISKIAIIVILLGLAGSFYLSNNRGLLLSKDEQGAYNFLKNNSSENAVIISTQHHTIGLAAYAERDFVKIGGIDSIDYSDFSEQAKNKFRDNIYSYPAEYKTQIVDLKGNVVKEENKVLIKHPEILLDRPVYFVYSRSRFDNTKFVGNPNYNKQNDIDNLEKFFSSDFISHATYSDQKVVIYRVQ